jgi:hypothetical protein
MCSDEFGFFLFDKYINQYRFGNLKMVCMMTSFLGYDHFKKSG